MKEDFKSISLADLCSWFGVTRQAYYQSKNRVQQDLIEQEILLDTIGNWLSLIANLLRRRWGIPWSLVKSQYYPHHATQSILETLAHYCLSHVSQSNTQILTTDFLDSSGQALVLSLSVL